MSKKITIIMPFLNEGQEPVRTMESLYDITDSSLFNVIAIDDKSDEPTNGLEKFPDLSLLKNYERIGVDMSRTKAAYFAETPFIFIIDGHMRFKDKHWLENVVDALEDEPYSAFCTKCISLNKKNTDINQENLGRYVGADLLIYEHHGNAPDRPEDYRDILEPKWAKTAKPQRIYDIPCILGANYGFSRDWFMKVRGFSGLKSWGSSEPYISLKYWLSGGKCQIIKDVEVGHIFRSKNPYPIPLEDLIYNKMYIVNTIFPQSMQQELINFLGLNPITTKASKMIRENKRAIAGARAYYKTVFTKSMYTVLDNLNINYKWPDGVQP